MLRLLNVSLDSLTSFHVPALADTYLRIETEEDLNLLARTTDHLAGDYLLMGGGSNLLFVGDYQGTLIHMAMKGMSVREESGWVRISVGAGVIWDELVEDCVRQGYYGLENLSLIPGYTGAAPVQNIGAYGCELQEVFESLEALDLRTGAIQTFKHEQCHFGYRDSVFKKATGKHYLITRVDLRLSRDPGIIRTYDALSKELHEQGISEPHPADIREAVISVRRQKLPDPNLLGNAGSFFKNPVVEIEVYKALKERFPDIVSFPTHDGKQKLAAAWLIDQRGWKAYREGDAGVHHKQALVLVNHGKATGAQILDLAKRIRDDVRNAFGVTLEPEVNIIGDSLS